MQTKTDPGPLRVIHGYWNRFVTARKRGRVRRIRRTRRTPRGFAPASAIDPIALTILAVNRLGPATFRTVWKGAPATVTVPDQRTAEIFRAALIEMQKTRTTDRLVTVEVAKDAAA